MREVRSKGQLTRSQDLTAWLGVGAGAVMLPGTIDRATNAAVDQVFSIRAVMESPEPAKAVHAMEQGLGAMADVLGPMFVVVFVVVLAGSAVQGGVHFKKFRAEFEHFNLLTGVKRLFGMQAVWGGVKALLKATVVGLVLYSVVQGLIPVLLTAGGLPVSGVIQAAADGIGALVQFAVAAGLVLAAADVLVVMRRNRKKTRMSKKEVTDENKNTEGDPLVRSQRRSRQLAMSRNRMIAAIADADVVLVNPTHVAVALKYDAGKSAPRVVAKGAGVIAARIRAEAEAKEVPMVQDVPLARALHSACELGQEIPVELYRAVAGVLAFVMSLKSRGAARGLHRMADAV
jgi:flagellar biosynthetic protein FlhB